MDIRQLCPKGIYSATFELRASPDLVICEHFSFLCDAEIVERSGKRRLRAVPLSEKAIMQGGL